jgi:hypothetical protein
MNDPKLGSRSVKGELDFALNRALVCAAFQFWALLPGAEAGGGDVNQHVATMPWIVGNVKFIWHQAIIL